MGISRHSVNHVKWKHSVVPNTFLMIRHDTKYLRRTLIPPWINYAEIADDNFNTLRAGQNYRRFADDIFKCIFLNENVRILITILLKFVPKGPNNNIPALVQIMAWRCPGDKPLSEAMVVSSRTHICVTRPQWLERDIINGNWLIGVNLSPKSVPLGMYDEKSSLV